MHSRFLTYKMQKIPNVATIVQILYLIKAFRKVQWALDFQKKYKNFLAITLWFKL